MDMLKIEAGINPAELMTAAQVARAHGYTRNGVIQAVRRGQLRSVGQLPTRNGALLFAPADVEAWRASARMSGRTVYGEPGQ